jgi:hypothetical protein
MKGAAPTWLKGFASGKRPKRAPAGATEDAAPCEGGEGVAAARHADECGDVDDYMDARLLADAASRDEEMQHKKREARAAARPEPQRPLKERMREELEKGLNEGIDSR